MLMYGARRCAKTVAGKNDARSRPSYGEGGIGTGSTGKQTICAGGSIYAYFARPETLAKVRKIEGSKMSAARQEVVHKQSTRLSTQATSDEQNNGASQSNRVPTAAHNWRGGL
jgi:hypothetical protein